MPTATRYSKAMRAECFRGSTPDLCGHASNTGVSDQGALSVVARHPGQFLGGFGDSGRDSAYATSSIEKPKDGQAHPGGPSGWQALHSGHAAIERDCKEGTWTCGG